jgi:hypothetical protein
LEQNVVVGQVNVKFEPKNDGAVKIMRWRERGYLYLRDTAKPDLAQSLFGKSPGLSSLSVAIEGEPAVEIEAFSRVAYRYYRT